VLYILKPVRFFEGASGSVVVPQTGLSVAGGEHERDAPQDERPCDRMALSG